MSQRPARGRAFIGTKINFNGQRDAYDNDMDRHRGGQCWQACGVEGDEQPELFMWNLVKFQKTERSEAGRKAPNAQLGPRAALEPETKESTPPAN